MAVLRINPDALREITSGPQGPLYRYLVQKAALVETEAKRRCPVDTGRLRSSIHTEMFTDDGQVIARIGTNVGYARYIEEGTGIYGPRGRPIRPVRAQFLSWVPRGQSKRVFAREVRGVPPRPFLMPALESVFPGRVQQRGT